MLLTQLTSAPWAQTQDVSSRHHLSPARAEQGQQAGTGAQRAELGGEVTGACAAGLEGPRVREPPRCSFCHRYPLVQFELGVEEKRN